MSYQSDCEAYTPEQAYRDHCDYEFNARYDYIREAFGDTARDLDNMYPDEFEGVPELGPVPSWEFRLCECAGRMGNDVKHLNGDDWELPF
jgi:hypothetical protein